MRNDHVASPRTSETHSWTRGRRHRFTTSRYALDSKFMLLRGASDPEQTQTCHKRGNKAADPLEISPEHPDDIVAGTQARIEKKIPDFQDSFSQFCDLSVRFLFLSLPHLNSPPPSLLCEILQNKSQTTEITPNPEWNLPGPARKMMTCLVEDLGTIERFYRFFKLL